MAWSTCPVGGCKAPWELIDALLTLSRSIDLSISLLLLGCWLALAWLASFGLGWWAGVVGVPRS